MDRLTPDQRCGRHFVPARTRTTATATLVAFLMLVFFSASPASAFLIFTVTNTNDSGTGSLRQAILDANAADSAESVISFGTVRGTITLTSGVLEISAPVNIAGPGASSLAISGNNNSAIFLVDSGATVFMSGITIEKGKSTSSHGGGIDNNGTLTLTNCTISDNSPGFGFSGGGIRNSGTLTVTNSTISGNSVGNGFGGGIENTGTLTVTNSAISGNSADDGGGILNFNVSAALTITNSTISGNSVSGAGGGIYNDGGTATVTNCTIAGNSAAENSGGGIDNSGSATFKNTIVANSTNENCISFGTFTSDGHNLSDDSSCNSVFNGTGDLNDASAGLAPNGLQNNGGPTQTIALLATSPAVDAVPMSPINYCSEIDGTTPITTDQRGDPRPDPEDGPDGPCDIGAYEFQAPTPVSGKLKVSPQTLKFDDVTVNNPVTKTVTVTNVGKITKKNRPLPILIEMEGVNQTPSPFSVTTPQCDDDNLMPSGKGIPKTETMCKITVQFSPTQAISYSGTMTIADNLAPSEMQVVHITGKGRAAK